jgi:membrane protease YdiL (CAAX protease family)
MTNIFASIEHRLNISPTSPTPWTPRDVAWGLGVFVLWICFLAMVGLTTEIRELPIDASLVVIFGEIVLLIPVWYLTIHKYGLNWADLGLGGFHAQAVGTGCGLMVVAFVFNFIYASFLSLFDLQVQPDIALLFEGTDFPMVLLIGGAIIAPVVEEIFFRGFVFTGLRGKWGWKKAALASAGLFAIAHVIPTSLLPIFILGMIFAFLYQLYGSIWPAILMHSLTNSLALAAAYAVSQGWIPVP